MTATMTPPLPTGCSTCRTHLRRVSIDQHRPHDRRDHEERPARTRPPGPDLPAGHGHQPGRIGAEMTAHPSPTAAIRWAVLVPLKPPTAAKSRLAVPHDTRVELVLAMAGDVVEAALACTDVDLVAVVADSADGLEPLQRQGAAIVIDPDGLGLNASLRHAAAVAAARDASYGIASLVGDVAAARPEQLTRVLAAAAIEGTAFVPDAAGRGTTLVAARRWAAFLPEYGNHSRRRHARGGLHRADVAGPRRTAPRRRHGGRPAAHSESCSPVHAPVRC